MDFRERVAEGINNNPDYQESSEKLQSRGSKPSAETNTKSTVR